MGELGTLSPPFPVCPKVWRPGAGEDGKCDTAEPGVPGGRKVEPAAGEGGNAACASCGLGGNADWPGNGLGGKGLAWWPALGGGGAEREPGAYKDGEPGK